MIAMPSATAAEVEPRPEALAQRERLLLVRGKGGVHGGPVRLPRAVAAASAMFQRSVGEPGVAAWSIPRAAKYDPWYRWIPAAASATRRRGGPTHSPRTDKGLFDRPAEVVVGDARMPRSSRQGRHQVDLVHGPRILAVAGAARRTPGRCDQKDGFFKMRSSTASMRMCITFCHHQSPLLSLP